MDDKLCLVLIENRYERLTAAEKKIADVIVKDSHKVVDMSVAELAGLAGVAPSAVIRFCTTLGFEGFGKLKIALAVELSRNKWEGYSTEVGYSDNSSDVLARVFESGKKALDDTLKMLDKIIFDRAVAAMVHAKNITFFGIGTSASVVSDAGLRIMQLGYSAASVTDPMFMRVAAGNLTPADVAIAVSLSGRSRDTVDALRLAHEKGAITVAITSMKDSPVCEYADMVLGVYSDQLRYPVEPVSSRLAAIAVLDAMKVTLSLQNAEKTTESIRLQKEVMKSIRGEDL